MFLVFFLCLFPLFKCNIFKESGWYVYKIVIITLRNCIPSPTTVPGHYAVSKVNEK